MTIKEPSSEPKRASTTETERKFLVREIPANLESCDQERMRQGYVLDEEGKGALRIRQEADEFVLAFKGVSPGGDTSKGRVEIQKPLTQEEFNKMWPLTEGRRVEKTRFYIPYGEYIIELDLFDDGNAMAEVEFDSEEQARAFVPPDWLGQDVSADNRYGNLEISKNGFPQDV